VDALTGTGIDRLDMAVENDRLDNRMVIRFKDLVQGAQSDLGKKRRVDRLPLRGWHRDLCGLTT